MSDSTYAFPKQRKEPLNDASHVRNAIARFDQVKDVTDAEREEAFHNIKAAAKKFGVDMTETSWRQLGNKPHTPQKSQLAAASRWSAQNPFATNGSAKRSPAQITK